MSFLEGIKNSLKLDEVAGNVAAKVQSAKEYASEKQHSLAESGLGKTAMAKMGSLAEGAGQVGSYISETLDATPLGKYLPSGGGKRQSPIDIVTSEAKFDESLGDGSFTFGYNARDCTTVLNTGSELKVLMADKANSTLSAVHYTGEQQLKEIRLYWGTEPMNGSAHMIGGVGYAGELHLVHMNTKYTTMEDAMKHGDGLAVLAVFLNESHDDNQTLAPLINLSDKVAHLNETANLDRGLDIRALLPDKLEYWTYEGSFVSPPHTECVVYTVFRASISISSRQLDKLRQIYAVTREQIEASPTKIGGSGRGTQPTNGRRIRASFRSGGVIEQ